MRSIYRFDLVSPTFPPGRGNELHIFSQFAKAEAFVAQMNTQNGNRFLVIGVNVTGGKSPRVRSYVDRAYRRFRRFQKSGCMKTNQ